MGRMISILGLKGGQNDQYIGTERWPVISILGQKGGQND